MRYRFYLDRISYEDVRRNFMAMKWAYSRAKKELDEKVLVITETIFRIIRKIEKRIEITAEDVEAVLGRKLTEKELEELKKEEEG